MVDDRARSLPEPVLRALDALLEPGRRSAFGLLLARADRPLPDLRRSTRRRRRAPTTTAPRRPTTPSRVYIERCEFLKDNPPGPDWDGSWTLVSK